MYIDMMKYADDVFIGRYAALHACLARLVKIDVNAFAGVQCSLHHVINGFFYRSINRVGVKTTYKINV